MNLRRARLYAVGTAIFFAPISTAMVEIAAVILLFLTFAECARARPFLSAVRRVCSKPVYLSFLLFYLGMGVSLFFASDFRGGLEAWLSKWGEGFIFFLSVTLFVRRDDLPFLMKVFLSSLALICIDGIYQKTFGYDFLRHFNVIVTDDYTATTASFHHYNNFASYLAMAFFFVFGTAMHKQTHGAGKLALYVLMFSVFLNLLFACSRGAWLAFFSAAMLLALLPTSVKVKRWCFALIALLIICVVASPVLRERALFIITTGGDEQRFLLWRAGWMMFLDSPFAGTGLGSFMSVLPVYYAKAGLSAEFAHQYLHNSYFQILVETGVFVFIFFAAGMFFLSLHIWRGIQRNPDITRVSAAAAFFALCVQAFFDNHFYSLQLRAIFWLAAGFCYILFDSGRETPQPNDAVC